MNDCTTQDSPTSTIHATEDSAPGPIRRVQSVLFVTTSYPRFSGDFPGTFVHGIAKSLVQCGMRVTVVAPAAPGYPNQSAIDGVEIERFAYFYPAGWQCLAYGQAGGVLSNLRHNRLAPLQIPSFLATMTRKVIRKQSDVDLIHCHWLPTAAAAVAARKVCRAKVPIVLTNWGSDTRTLPRWLAKSIVSRVEGCLSPSIEMDEHLASAGRTNFCRLQYACDEDRFNRSSVPTSLREELGLDESIPIIAFVARLVDFKDPVTFIQACKLLKDRGRSFRALIAGDGDMMSQCRTLVESEALQECVRFLGMRSDPERIFRVSSAAVHISPIENVWAGSIVEAMQMRVPVVLSDAGRTTQVFSHETDCLIVPSRNPVRLADALERILEDHALSRHLTNSAATLLMSHGKTGATMVQSIRDYYDSIYREYHHLVT